tara:strand:+ start:1590 stop:2510 length:921 start_codon:yes stop_codon:yes gene_type:complete
MPEAAKTEEIETEEPKQLAIEIDDEPSEEKEELVVEVEAKEDEEVKLEDYSDNVKRRIGKMTAKLRESERREQAATEYARAVNVELEQIKQKTHNLDNSFVNEFDNRVQTQEQLLKSELKKAIDVGDSDKQAEIQVKLSSVAADKDKVNRVKRQRESAPPPYPVQPQQQVQPQPQPQPQPQQPQQVDPRAKKWADDREWFGEDRPMTLLALAEHESLLGEGYDPAQDGDTYYNELNKRIEDAFPHKFQKEKRRRTPKVAGASRTRINKNGKKEIVLTESEAKMADKLNVPREAYAKQLELLRQRSE